MPSSPPQAYTAKSMITAIARANVPPNEAGLPSSLIGGLQACALRGKHKAIFGRVLPPDYSRVRGFCVKTVLQVVYHV